MYRFDDHRAKNASMGMDEDHQALASAAAGSAALCTIVNIDGTFSRRLGAQLAVCSDGMIIGSLSDGCLERQLASDLAQCNGPIIRRYGRGSDCIDFRLPCGGGLDILLDPTPDRVACASALALLQKRQPAAITLPANDYLNERRYIPALQIRAFGEDPELGAFTSLAHASDIVCKDYSKSGMALGREPDMPYPDRWTATILLYHDHEWENAILKHALAGASFYIGAQGGKFARNERIARLSREGIDNAQIARIRGPVGIIPSSRTPRTLALSILSEIVAEYDALHPHG
jgi:xanthine dehydrogenase accessory factor